MSKCRNVDIVTSLQIFVLSDMQFDAAMATYHDCDREDPHQWNKTIHQLAVEKYARMGYELPEIGECRLHLYTGGFPVNR